MPAEGVRNSLSKCEKLHTAAEFALLKEHGVSGRDTFFTVLVVKAGEACAVDYPRLGIICSRRFHHSAVIRNRARRLITECFRLNKRNFSACDILVIPRRAIMDRGLAEVTDHFLKVLRKLNCIEEPQKAAED